MNRRDFMLSSSSALLIGGGLSRFTKPSVAVDFQLSTPKASPSNVDSVTIDFQKLEVTPNYMDTESNIKIKVKLNVEGYTTREKEIDVSFTNGQTKKLKRKVPSIVVDSINESNLITGSVTVEVQHPDITDSFIRRFTVSDGNAPDSSNLHANYDIKSQDESDGEAISVLKDQSGNNDLVSVGSPTMRIGDFNGNPVARLDGSNDAWEITSGWDDLSQPFTTYFVVGSSPSAGAELFGETTNRNVFSVRRGCCGGENRSAAGSKLDSSGQTFTKWTTIFNGSNSVVEIDETQVSSGNIGSNGISDGLSVGYRQSENDQYADMDFAQLLIYDTAHDSSTINKVYNYLNSRWGI